MSSVNSSTKISVRKWLKEDKLLNKLARIVEDTPNRVYLVGGYLRDGLLGRRALDIDVLIEGEIKEVASKFSEVVGGNFFYLDKRRDIGRVVLNEGKVQRTVDFSSFKKDVIKDLVKRDFTVNTLALDLSLLRTKKEIERTTDMIDFVGGLEDLKDKKIRMVSEASLCDDPIRLLRAVRLSAELGFKIEEKTALAIKKNASLLSKVAGERIQEELFLIFSLPNSSQFIDKAASLKLIDTIFPELASLRGVIQDTVTTSGGKKVGYHHLDAFNHSLLTLDKVEKVVSNLKVYYPKFQEKITTHLGRSLDGKLTCLVSLKLGALLHDLGKEKTKTVDKDGRIHFYRHSKVGVEIFDTVSERLRLSRKLADFVSKLIREHMRPGYLESEVESHCLAKKAGTYDALSKRAVFRFLRDCEDKTVEVIVLSLADRLAAKGPWSTSCKIKLHREFTNFLMGTYFKEGKRQEKELPLVRGDELIKKFKLKPSPLIGRVLRKIEEARFEGRVKTKKEALALAEEFLKKRAAD